MGYVSILFFSDIVPDKLFLLMKTSSAVEL